MNKKLRVFVEEPGFLKLFTLFKEKYRSLGRIGGSVKLDTFSHQELVSIAGFLGESVDLLLEKEKILLLSFEKALLRSFVSEYTLVQILEEVLQEPILTKSEESKLEQEQNAAYFVMLRSRFPEGIWWWNWIQAKQPDTRWIWSLYKQDSNDLLDKLKIVYKAFMELSRNTKYERLPLFSQRTTGNPHFFDQDKVTGKLLLHCMYVDQQTRGIHDTSFPRTNEELNELLGKYRLLKDDLWSFVTCRGLLAEDENGGLHPVWKAAYETNSSLNVPIKELIKVQKVWTAKGEKVWIVENSSVCSTILDEVPGAPVICTHGQFRTASWLILDLLVQSGCKLFYSGDIDPEGIAMAQRLKERYGSQVNFWRMDKDSYESVLSEEDISSRLSKVGSITTPELEELIQTIRHRKKAGYQEGLIDKLIQDIRSAYMEQ